MKGECVGNGTPCKETEHYFGFNLQKRHLSPENHIMTIILLVIWWPLQIRNGHIIPSYTSYWNWPYFGLRCKILRCKLIFHALIKVTWTCCTRWPAGRCSKLCRPVQAQGTKQQVRAQPLYKKLQPWPRLLRSWNLVGEGKDTKAKVDENARLADKRHCSHCLLHRYLRKRIKILEATQMLTVTEGTCVTGDRL